MPTLEHPYRKEIVQREINAHHCAVKVGFTSGQEVLFEMSVEQLKNFVKGYVDGASKVIGSITMEGAEEVFAIDLSKVAYYKVTDWVGEDI